MVLSMIVEVFIKAFLLFILLYIVARDEADFDFRKVTMVTAGIVLGGVLIEGLLTRHIGLWTLVPLAALTIFMVMQFCWVRFWRAMLVAIPFLILNVMISSAVFAFNEKANQAVARGLQGPVSEKDMQEALHFLKQSMGDSGTPLPFEKKPKIEMEPTLEQIILKKFMAFIPSKKPALQPVSAVNTAANAGGQPRPMATENDSGETVDWPAAEKKLAVIGVLVGRDGARVAVVNNQVIKEGELIQVRHEKVTYRWRAASISSHAVSWERLTAYAP